MSELPRDLLANDKAELEESKIAGQEAFNAARRLLWGIRPTTESVPIYDPGGDDFRIIHPRQRYLNLGKEGEFVLSDTDQSRDVPRVSERHISVEIRGAADRSEWAHNAGIRPCGELLFCLDIDGNVAGGITNIFDGPRSLDVIARFGNPNDSIPEEQLHSSSR